VNKDKGGVLTTLARNSIAERLEAHVSEICTDFGWLHKTAACFVTLHKLGCLRGCIGSIEAHRPLIEDVCANAVSAAFNDPRFPPLTRNELENVNLEVSVLTPLRALHITCEADALAQLRPEQDGIVLEYGQHRGTFLPQVWQQLPEPEKFLLHLKLKAGLAADFWHKDIRMYRYTVEKYTENKAENRS